MTRGVTAIGAALIVAAFAFVFRFNMLGGTLGGFDNDEFAHLLRADAMLRGEQPLRDFADAELRGAWPSLSYAVPAWAQRVWGRSLLAEAYLTAGALALSYAVLFLVALDLSRRQWIVALLAALLALATTPKLYNYPKVLAMALGAAAVRYALVRRSTPRLAIVAGVTAMATLFRHDYGVYLAFAMTAGIVAQDFGRWRDAATRVGVFAGATAIFLLPSLIWVQRYKGIFKYLGAALRTSGVESRRTTLAWPTIDVSMPFDAPSAIAITYYLFWRFLCLPLASSSFGACGRMNVLMRQSARLWSHSRRSLSPSTCSFCARISLPGSATPPFRWRCSRRRWRVPRRSARRDRPGCLSVHCPPHCWC